MKKNFFGFTLIELLIVMAVIGGLAAISVNVFPSAAKRARDSERRSDIKQYQTAMESYNNKTGTYPVSVGLQDIATTLCSTLSLPSCPEDPKTTPKYKVNSIAGSYVIYATLEQPTTGTTAYFVVCSDGRSGECTTAPSGSACATGAGSCP